MPVRTTGIREPLPLTQLHVAVHGGEADAGAALAERCTQPAGVDTPTDRHRVIGEKPTIDGAEVDVRVDVVRELGYHGAVDARELKVGPEVELPHAGPDAPVHRARVDR